jgi:hypothetical protein
MLFDPPSAQTMCRHARPPRDKMCSSTAGQMHLALSLVKYLLERVRTSHWECEDTDVAAAANTHGATKSARQ